MLRPSENLFEVLRLIKTDRNNFDLLKKRSRWMIFAVKVSIELNN